MMALSDIAASMAAATRIDRCERHGEYAATLLYAGRTREYRTSCPRCAEASREAAEADRRQQETAAEHARKQAAFEARLERACVPARFRSRSFESFCADTEPQRAALAVARDFARAFDARRGEGATLVFSGRPGTGKSHLGCAIAQAVTRAGYTALYATVRDIIRMLRDTWARDAQRTEREVLADLIGVDVLVLDEVGVGFGSDAEKLQFFDVLDGRYRESQPTVILTNLGRKDLAEFVGQRAYDRMRDAGTWVAFDWESHRGRGIDQSRAT